MSAPSSGNTRKCAIRLVATGIGTLVAGPLGAVVGGTLGGLFSEQAAKLIETYAHASGEALSELGVHYLYDQLNERREHPPFERVVQQALRLALEDVRRGLPLDLREKYADWFENWDSILSSADPPTVAGQLSPGVISSDAAAQGRVLDQVFQSAMERLDGEARASRKLSIIATDSFRIIPEELLHLLVEGLPAPLQSHFRAFTALPEHQSARIAVQQNFQDDALSAFASLDATTQRTETKVERILEIQERELRRALQEKEIAQRQAREERTQREEYEQQYRKLLEDVEARTEEPGESQFAGLLASGDLEGAVALKTKQIEAGQGKLQGEAKKLARDWSELGRVHALRFAWAKALECYREAWRLSPEDVGYGFQYAYFAHKQNRFSESVDAYLQTLPALTDLVNIATALNNLALLYTDTQRTKEAEQYYRVALAIRRRLAEASPEAHLPNVAMTLHNLAILYRATQRTKDAEQSCQEALAIRRRLAEANPEVYLPEVAITLDNLAILYRATQRTKGAEESSQEALTIYRRFVESKPDAYLPYLAATLNIYGTTQPIKEAERSYLEALAIYRQLAETNPEAHLPNLAVTLDNMANLYRDTHRMLEAGRSYQEALDIRRRLAEVSPDAHLPSVGATLNNLAILYRATWRMTEAEQSDQEALTIYRRLAEANPEAHLPGVARTLNNLAVLYRDMQRMKEAEQCCLESLAIRRRLAEANPEVYLPDLATSLHNLGNLYRGTPQMKEAEQPQQEELAIYRRLAEANPEAYLPYVATALNNLAILYRETQRTREAQDYCGEARAIIEPLWRHDPQLHGNQLATINGIGALLAGPERAEEACELARQSLAAANDTWLKQAAQKLIDQFCAPPSPTA